MFQKLKNCPTKDLIQIIKECSNKRDVIRVFGFKGSDPRAFRYVASFIEEYNVDVSHHTDRGKPLRRKYSLRDVENAIKASTCMTEVLRMLGLSEIGGNAITIKRIIKQHNFNIDHFDNSSRRKNHKRTIKSEVLVENSKISRTALRSLLLRENLIPYRCDACKIDEWKGKSLILDLDHINGIRTDNRITNLRFLCPNCHSQTPTFRGRNNS